SVAAFRKASPFPAERFAGPAIVAGVDWSDQWSFWREGYPGVMVTDTAPYRYPHYHSDTDTPDKIDYDSFARVVAGLVEVVRAAAND
ncbi:MAG: M28 family peptidase, partial [Pseudomonadota bacterium]